jgi:hypothetical protein
VTNEEQLQWEARMGRPAAFAAFASGFLLLVGSVAGQTVLEDRPGIEPLADFLLSVEESPGTVILGSVLEGVGVLLLVGVFYYLFRATVHRLEQVPGWLLYLLLFGPLMYALGQIVGAFDRIDVGEAFAAQDYSFEDEEPDSRLARCPATRGELGEDCAEELLRTSQGGLVFGLSLAGGLSLVLVFILMSLRARRAGLLSQFMGTLGVIAGVLLLLHLLQLVPFIPVVVQAFWLGALGALFLGNWPGGRGPAWATGTAEPWPLPAGRQRAGPARAPAPEEPPPAAEPEAVPERPASRKRKRKKRR